MWLLIENPEGNAELIGAYETKKECLYAISGNCYTKAQRHAWRKQCYYLSSDKKHNKYLICKAHTAIAMGYDYLVM